MNENIQLSVYELGIIKNSLRERIITLEDFRTNYLNNDNDNDDEKNKMSINIEAFKLELMELKDKIDYISNIETSSRGAFIEHTKRQG